MYNIPMYNYKCTMYMLITINSSSMLFSIKYFPQLRNTNLSMFIIRLSNALPYTITISNKRTTPAKVAQKMAKVYEQSDAQHG